LQKTVQNFGHYVTKHLYMKLQFLPHRQQSVTIRKTGGLILCRQMIGVLCENNTEHINNLPGTPQRLSLLLQVAHIITPGLEVVKWNATCCVIPVL